MNLEKWSVSLLFEPLFIYSSVCRNLHVKKLHMNFKKKVPPDNFRIITSRQLSMSSVTNPGTCWYFCETLECTSDNRKKGKVLLHAECPILIQLINIQANKRTSTTPLPIPLSWRYFFNCGTCQQKNINDYFHLNGIWVLILTKVNTKAIYIDSKHLHREWGTFFKWRD